MDKGYLYDFLMNMELTYRPFIASEKGDHDHCNLCGAKFSERENDLHYGYVAKDNDDVWICEECYKDYHDSHHWVVKNNTKG